jgi:hypothetical protein
MPFTTPDLYFSKTTKGAESSTNAEKIEYSVYT